MSGPILRAPVLRVMENGRFRHLAADSALGRRVASRFVAGESLDQAMEVAAELNRSGIASMLDHLGENVTTPAQAGEAANSYVAALERARLADRLDCAVSIKLTQLGLDISRELCTEHVEKVLAAAEGAATIVMVDMESHEYVDRTLDIFRELRERHERVGVCLQSYLLRTAEDVRALPAASMVRLVKGAYLEPPTVVHPARREVDANFARLFATLIAEGHSVHVATHDERLIMGAIRYMERHAVPWSRAEFQMLHGIRRDLQGRLARDGYPMRVYIPYGTEWYPYLTRRLAERPANMWFFLSNLVRSGR